MDIQVPNIVALKMGLEKENGDFFENRAISLHQIVLFVVYLTMLLVFHTL
jgi:hypothetical protein